MSIRHTFKDKQVTSIQGLLLLFAQFCCVYIVFIVFINAAAVKTITTYTEQI